MNLEKFLSGTALFSFAAGLGIYTLVSFQTTQLKYEATKFEEKKSLKIVAYAEERRAEAYKFTIFSFLLGAAQLGGCYNIVNQKRKDAIRKVEELSQRARLN